jgi:hypothetical protein
VDAVGGLCSLPVFTYPLEEIGSLSWPTWLTLHNFYTEVREKYMYTQVIRPGFHLLHGLWRRIRLQKGHNRYIIRNLVHAVCCFLDEYRAQFWRSRSTCVLCPRFCGFPKFAFASATHDRGRACHLMCTTSIPCTETVVLFVGLPTKALSATCVEEAWSGLYVYTCYPVLLL